MNVPLGLALAATGATLFDNDAAPPTLRVNTDTRTIEPGDTFLALRGERFDGHDFAAEAIRLGASMLVLERYRDARRRAPPRCSWGRRKPRTWPLRALRVDSIRARSQRSPAAPGRRRPKNFSRNFLRRGTTGAFSVPRRTRIMSSASASCSCGPRTTRTTCSSSRWARAITVTLPRWSRSRVHRSVYSPTSATRISRLWAHASASRRRSGRFSPMGHARYSMLPTPSAACELVLWRMRRRGLPPKTLRSMRSSDWSH